MGPTFCALIFGAATVMAQSRPAEVSVTAKVRDFKEVSPGDTAGAHPHFNNQNGCSAQELGVFSVKSDLLVNGDSRMPQLMDSLPSTLAKCYTPKDRFPEWFTDMPGVNRAFTVDMRFQWNEGKGTYTFSDKTYFPIDNGGAYTPVVSGETTFGHLQTGMVENLDVSKHNYGFTMEMHTVFTYTEGQAQRVEISGDDDIWLFLNGKRVVDLGGVHQLQTATVNLDSLKSALGLETGRSYAFDFYFAERHTTSSSCTITTNLAIGTEVSAFVKPKVSLKTAFKAGPIGIYDRAGRLLRTLDARSEAAASLEWDRMDTSGRVAAPGVYFWRSATSGPAASGLVVVR